MLTTNEEMLEVQQDINDRVVVKQAQPLKTLKRGADPLFPAAALRTVVSSRYGSDTFLYAYVTT